MPATVEVEALTKRESNQNTEPEGSTAVIDVDDVSKRYGRTLAVDHLSFTVQPGRVTGFLGPNGSGKSTTMRMILGRTIRRRVACGSTADRIRPIRSRFR